MKKPLRYEVGRLVYLVLPDQFLQALTGGTLRDPAAQVEIFLADIFR